MDDKLKPANSVPAEDPPTVFVVEDDDDYRHSLVLVIQTAGYNVLGYASPAELIDAYDPNRPGCLLLDLNTPGYNALELYETLVQRGGIHPFIVISAAGSIPKVAQVMRGGAIDFLTKPVEHQLLIDRVSEAIRQDTDRRATKSRHDYMKAKLDGLTKREREVLKLVTQGLASKQIAKQLDIETKTVDVHRSNIMKKMDVSSFVELASLLASQALIQPPTPSY